MTTAELSSPAERVARGRAAGASTPRSSHAQLELAAERDPVGLLEAQGRSGVPALLPIRYGRALREAVDAKRLPASEGV
jgi:hypothetical protein